MKMWGTNPRAAFEADKRALLTRASRLNDNNRGINELRHNSNQYDVKFGYLDGRNNIPTNYLAARITQQISAVQNTAKLGFLPLAQVSDLAAMNGELRQNGVPLYNRLTDTLGAYLPKNAVKKEVISNIMAETEYLLSETHSLLGGNDQRLIGRATRGVADLQNFMFKIMGANMMTRAIHKSSAASMATHYGKFYRRGWDALGEYENAMMQGFKIGKPEWDLLNTAEWLKPSRGRATLPHA